MGLEERSTQCQKILIAFKDAIANNINGGYLNCLDLGRLYIMQPHARMFELERDGYKFEKRRVKGHTYMEYKLIEEPRQTNMFEI